MESLTNYETCKSKELEKSYIYKIEIYEPSEFR